LGGDHIAMRATGATYSMPVARGAGAYKSRMKIPIVKTHERRMGMGLVRNRICFIRILSSN
jgi:hypothetical protein